jgi:hypothetical protein
MRVCCYSTWADQSTQEQLWLALKDKGWISAGPTQGINYFYIPEHLLTWCKLIDPTLKHHPKNDWIV